MYEKAIALLQPHIRSLQKYIDDKTGVITSKKQAADNIADYKQAIVVLKRAQCPGKEKINRNIFFV
jgi:hypothetical protein